MKNIGAGDMALGSIAAIIIAVYLGMVVKNGNTSQLFAQLKNEGGFLKWALAVVLLVLIIRSIGGTVGAELGLLALLGLALVAGAKILPVITNFFKPSATIH